MTVSANAPWIVITAATENSAIPGIYSRELAGKPLVLHAVDKAKEVLSSWPQAKDHILVIGSEDLALDLAFTAGVKTLKIPLALENYFSYSQAAVEIFSELGSSENDSLITFDATLPLIKPVHLLAAHNAVAESQKSSALVFAGKQLNNFTSSTIELIRLSVSTPPENRIPVTEAEAIEVATFSDWAVAEHWASRKRILIRTDVNDVLDESHARRSLGLATALARHEISIVIGSNQTLSKQFFDGTGFETKEIDDDLELLALARKEGADLVVLDRHQNAAEFVTLLRGFCKVVAVEDFGAGGAQADVLINTMIENPTAKQDDLITGIDGVILPPDFEYQPAVELKPVVSQITIFFSGSDNSGLTEKTLRALEFLDFGGRVNVIRGLGSNLIDPKGYDVDLKVYSHQHDLAKIVGSTDLAIASMDYNLSLFCAMGVPTLAMAQHASDLAHLQAKLEHGVLGLGIGAMVGPDTLAAHLDRLIQDFNLREALHRKGVAQLGKRSNVKVAKNLLNKLGF